MWQSYLLICDALRDLVSFVQFKNHEKHPWSSATFRRKFQAEVCNFTKSSTLPWLFFHIFHIYHVQFD